MINYSNQNNNTVIDGIIKTWEGGMELFLILSEFVEYLQIIYNHNVIPTNLELDVHYSWNFPFQAQWTRLAITLCICCLFECSSNALLKMEKIQLSTSLLSDIIIKSMWYFPKEWTFWSFLNVPKQELWRGIGLLQQWVMWYSHPYTDVQP